MKFPRANAVLGIDNQPHGDKPFVQTKRTVFHDTAMFDGKLLFAAFAAPNTTCGDEAMLYTITKRAGDTVRPAQWNHVLQAGVLVSKELDGVLNCLGLAKLFFHKRTLAKRALCVKCIIIPLISNPNRSLKTGSDRRRYNVSVILEELIAPVAPAPASNVDALPGVAG